MTLLGLRTRSLVPRKPEVCVFGGLEMLTHQHNKRLRVISLQQPDHLRVLSTYRREQVWISNAERADRVRLHREHFDHLDQRRISAGCKESLVEKQVFAKDAAKIASRDGGAVPSMDGFECVDEPPGRWQRNQTGCMTFHQLSSVVELFDLGHAIVPHRCASIGLASNEAHRLKIGERLAGHVTLDVEPLCQLFFDESLAGTDYAQRNLFFERRHNVDHARLRC